MEAEKVSSSLNTFELEAVLKWVDNFELSRCRRKLNRDFSDAVLLAEILKFAFPNLVELHNYTGRCAVQGKIENWDMLNRKVLKKLQVHLTPEEIEKLANADTSCIEEVLFRVMKRISGITRSINNKLAVEQISDVVTIKVWKQIGDQLEQVPQKMIQYSVYEELLDEHEEQKEKFREFQETINDLQSALESKAQIIGDLEQRLEKSKKDRSGIGSFKDSIAKLF